MHCKKSAFLLFLLIIASVARAADIPDVPVGEAIDSILNAANPAAPENKPVAEQVQPVVFGGPSVVEAGSAINVAKETVLENFAAGSAGKTAVPNYITDFSITFKRKETVLAGLRGRFPFLVERKPVVLTYSYDFSESSFSVFFVKPVSSDSMYKEKDLDEQISKVEPGASIANLSSGGKKIAGNFSYRVEKQGFSPYVFKFTVNLDLSESDFKPDFFEGIIVFDYGNKTGEFSGTRLEVPLKGYFNYCKTGFLDEQKRGRGFVGGD
jgi:hypothetical protein